MTPKEIQLLAQACRMAGVDANKITPANPFEKNGKVADLLKLQLLPSLIQRRRLNGVLLLVEGSALQRWLSWKLAVI